MHDSRLFLGLAEAMEFVGIAIIVLGSVLASLRYARTLGGFDFGRGNDQLRADLGRAILLGLQVLVAADIIGTVAVEPTFRNLGILGVVVLIRTFLSFSLEVEIHGRWPWQRAVGPQAPSAGH